MAGAARRCITPPVGCCLYGYIPDFHSTSKNDDLNVTAVAFKEGSTAVIMLSADLGDVENAINDRVRDLIAEKTGICRDNVIFCATHTHSGPTCASMDGWGEVDTEFVEGILLPQAVEAADEALANVKPAMIGIETVQSEVGINRRQILRSGDVILGQNPYGSFDKTMTVIAIRGTDGSGIVNMIHYGCHGTAAGRCDQISRDWSGIMVDRLQNESGVLSVFFNGAIGDTGPRLTNGQTVGNMSHVNELGCRAAFDAVRCWKAIKDYRTDIDLKVVSDELNLPYKPLPALEEVEAQIAAVKARCNPDELVNIARLEYKRLLLIKEAYEKGETEKHFNMRQTLVAVGPILFIPFPFEIFTDITLRLRDYSPYRHTLSLSNANGYNAYFPSHDQIPLGGYEIRTFTAGAAFCLTDDADTRIINENLRIAEEL